MIPKHQERDFVLRTLATIEQYDAFVMRRVRLEEQFVATLATTLMAKIEEAEMGDPVQAGQRTQVEEDDG